MSSQSILPELPIADENSLSQLIASFRSSFDHEEPASSDQTNTSTDSSSSSLSPNSGVRRLPIPTSSVNLSRASITFIDDEEGGARADFDGLSPEVAAADISIAPDGSFVETSSGQAAHELKKRYDRMMRVSVHKPSPFAITAFTNQHGRQMFRVAHRELNPPGRTAEQVEEEIERRATLHFDRSTHRSINTSPDVRRATHSVSDRRSPRRSRLSMNAFLPPTIFPANTPRIPDPTPPPPVSKDGTRSPPTRKLRKTRSNPQLSMQSQTRAQDSPSQPPFTGRGHSQSVTAADLPRFANSVLSAEPFKPVPHVDLFSELMQWQDITSSPTNSSSNPYSTRSRSTSASHSEHSEPAVIPNPFGPRVIFDSPSRPVPNHLNVPVIREMQSFESGLTARADPTPRNAQRSTILSQASNSSGNSSPTPSEAPSAPSTPSIPAAPYSPRPTSINRGYTLTMETLMYTQYSTEVFDVLQTYRGLPLLEKLLPDSTETTVIKMSVTADEHATPLDDPRFVIWGEVLPEVSDARTDQASSRSGRRSTKGSDDKPTLEPSADVPDKLLLAATIERWIAQLTSELNYDELLVFFMTYRTYIRSVDLCHLLICRFHWALGQHASEHDEMVRRIVLVRTFVAMRYWLLTFFEVDFIPSRELRLLMAGWLNALKKDPILQKHHGASGIVRKLVSVVRECKEVHSQRVRPSAPRSPANKAGLSSPSPSSPASSPPKKHPLVALFGKSFEGIPAKDWTFNDSDLDLDFIPDGQYGDGDLINGSSDMVPSGDSVLQQPLQRAIMEHRPSISMAPIPLPNAPATLPMHQNILSRAFVNTIGRLGRWKRVNSRPAALNSRHVGSAPLAVCGDVSAFDLELNVTDDLLTVRGGVEQYLKLIELNTQATLTNGAHTSPPTIPGVIAPPPPVPPPAEPIPPDSPILTESIDVPSLPAVATVQETEVEMPQSPRSADSKPVHVSLDSSTRPSSQPTSSRASSSGSSSYGQIIRSRFPGSGSSRHNPWGVDVISIDDLDLSDSDGEEPDLSSPPGLGRPPRRLPLRRDFEFVGRNRASVSSMGLHSARNSVSSVASSRTSGRPASGGLGTAIHQWQVDAIVDSLSDEDEAGDVEDALRRLEGHLSPQKQREKSSKVDNWVKTIRERLEAGDYGYPTDLPRDSTETGDGDHRASLAWSVHTEVVPAHDAGSAEGSPRSARHIAPLSADAESNDNITPVFAQTPYTVPLPPDPPEVDPAVPEEILRSRLSTSPMPLSPQSSIQSAANSTAILGQQPMPSKFAPHSQLPHVHRSWILSHSSGELAEHFSMIDKELFLEVKFEELIGDDWIRTVDETSVLDWGAYLKDRARWKAERRSGYKTSGLTTIRARFNLVACFVQSEIVLTPPASRHVLVSKFIRIAWKCYSLNNYSTLVAIIAGLRSEWVTRAMHKLWSRVNVYSLRMLKDLTSFASREDDFTHVQIAVRALGQAKTGGSDEASSIKGSSMRSGKDTAVATGVPFVGIYLSQLQRYSQLPDLIDPTAPNEAVGIDKNSNTFAAPAHPEVFATLAPLPPTMQLEPLINIHKQRLIAGTIKSLVAGQHLASRVAYPIDKRLFQRCLKLRGLDHETLHRVHAMYPDS